MGKQKSIVAKLRAMMPDCKDVSMLIIKEQETTLTFKQKLKMYFHVYVACKFCNLFYKQTRLLHKHIHQIKKNDGLDYKLSQEEKINIQTLIEKELKA